MYHRAECAQSVGLSGRVEHLHERVQLLGKPDGIFKSLVDETGEGSSAPPLITAAARTHKCEANMVAAA